MPVAAPSSAVTITKRDTPPCPSGNWDLEEAARARNKIARQEAREAEATISRERNSIPPARQAIVDSGIRHMSSILGQLVELRNSPEHDDYGRLQPTEPAFETAWDLLVNAAICAHCESREIPRGCACTDSDGGVRIEWNRPSASVRLNVPAEPKAPAYVYHEVGDDYAAEDATPELLSYWLRVVERDS